MMNRRKKKRRESPRGYIYMFGLLCFLAALPACGGKSTGRAYVSMGSADQVVEIDLGSKKIMRRVEGGNNPHGLAITPDGRFLYATSTREGPKEMKHSPLEGKRGHGHGEEPFEETDASLNTDGETVTVIDTSNGKVVGRIDVGGGTHHGVVAPDGWFAAFSVPSQGGIAVVSTQTQRVIQKIKTGAVSNYVLATMDGKELYVSNTDDGKVTAIDTDTWLVRKQIDVGEVRVISPKVPTAASSTS